MHVLGPLLLLGMLAAPPAPTPAPTVEALSEAFAKGRSFFVESHVVPALEQLEGGGFVTYRGKKSGKEVTKGPDVYVEYQLYDLIHFLMTHEKLGYPREHPLVQRSLAAWLARFDRKKGEWKWWSAEGCLHIKGAQVLQRAGHVEEAKAALRWNLASPMNANPGFSEGQSGWLIQSWGNPGVSLLNQNIYIRERVTAEMTLLNLLGLRELGRDRTDPVVRANLAWVDRWISSGDFQKDEFDRFTGLIKLPDLVEAFGLNRPRLLALAVDVLQPRLARPRSDLERDVYFRGEVIKALLHAEKLGAKVSRPVLDAALADLLRAQRPDGAWKTELIAAVPGQGILIAKLEGTATFVALGALREALAEAPPLPTPPQPPAAPGE